MRPLAPLFFSSNLLPPRAIVIGKNKLQHEREENNMGQSLTQKHTGQGGCHREYSLPWPRQHRSRTIHRQDIKAHAARGTHTYGSLGEIRGLRREILCHGGTDVGKRACKLEFVRLYFREHIAEECGLDGRTALAGTYVRTYVVLLLTWSNMGNRGNISSRCLQTRNIAGMCSCRAWAP